MKGPGLPIFSIFARARIITLAALFFSLAWPAAAQSIPELVLALRSRDPQISVPAEEALVKAGADAVPALVAQMRDHRRSLRMVFILVRIGAPAEPVLIGFLKDPAMRDSAGTALAQVVGPHSYALVPELLLCMKDPTVKHYCGTALIRAVGPKAKEQIPLLLETLKSKDDDFRLYGAAALGQIGAKAGVPALIGALKDSNSAVRQSAAVALGKCGKKAKEAVPHLEAAAQGEDGQLRYFVEEALEKIRS